MKRNHIIGAVVLFIIVAGGGFYAGTVYGKGSAPTRAGTTFGAGAAAGFAGRTGTRAGTGTGGGFTAGQIVAAGQGSISIQTPTGSSTEIVLLSPTTQILKTVSGTAADLTVGTSVTIAGSANSDGSLSATSIQLRPTQ